MITAAANRVEEVVALTDRVKRRREEYLKAVTHVCAERSRLVTEAWKQSEGEPLITRRALVFKRIMEGLPVVIREGELVVGSQTKYVRGAGLSVEHRPEDVFEMFGGGKPGGPGAGIVESTEAERESLLQDATYWQSRSTISAATRLEHQVLGDKIDALREARVVMANEQRPTGARLVDYEKVINKGLNGVIADARRRLQELTFSDERDVERHYFLQAAIICCEAVVTYARRHAELAQQMASKELDAVRKAELEKIARICRQVPETPARSFYEAIQSFWFVHLAVNLESASDLETPGRMDQYLYPVYEQDLKDGRMTRQEAAELLGCLWVKFTEREHIKGTGVREQAMSSQFQDVTIGGVDENGEDATNELTYLLLEVARQLKTAQPPLYLRCHKGTPQELWMKAAEVNLERGDGVPAFLNDQAVLLNLVGCGIPLRTARDWVANCCVLPLIGHAVGVDDFEVMNLCKVLEVTLNNGVDPRTGKRIGLATGDASDFQSFDQLYGALKKQFEYFLALVVQKDHLLKGVRRRNYDLPFASALYDDCIEKGLSLWQGGARYPQLAWGLQWRGDQNVADSLVAIKKLVFEDKRISMDRLLGAIKANFEGDGNEDIRRMCLAAPKYGNDDDYVDGIFDDLSLWAQRRVHQEQSIHGFPVRTAKGGATQHYAQGKVVGALPDGRKAGEPLADGALSPMRGADVKGPTAVICSASKVNHTELNASALFNLKINPAGLKTPENTQKFIGLIKTYFDRGGYHIQFNLIPREELLDAREHPERHRDLLVRVAGYSAYFVELVPEVQDEIIARTEHSLS
ncbi:MAG: hypothetical protein HYY32_04935 [Chloroflexi bacterium]|nr:hypothetical protein [Chloroflexota bacterium]